MIFKHDRDRVDWGLPVLQPGQSSGAIESLKEYLILIDRFMLLLFGREITITSYYRRGDKKYHGKMQAGDIRTHDMPHHERRALIALGATVRQGDPRLQMDPHDELLGTPNEHIHVEFDDDSL